MPPHNLPSILFFNDYIPANDGGGAVLMARLFEHYPADKIFCLCRSYVNEHWAKKRGSIAWKNFYFPASDRTGPWGIGRLKSFLDYLLLPALCVFGILIIKKHRIQLVMSTAQGHFFVAAAWAAKITRTPYILAVHDDCLNYTLKGRLPFKSMLRKIHHFLFKGAFYSAAQVYANGPFLQTWIAREFGVSSEIQGPAVLDWREQFRTERPFSSSCPKIVYLGSFFGAVNDCLEILRKTLQENFLSKYGIRQWQWVLYTDFPQANDLLRRQWEDERIKIMDWIPQEEIPKALMDADILFLPQTFRKEERSFVQTSLPAKVGDYLASGKPILAMAPDYAVVSNYARNFGFAQVVDCMEPERLATGLALLIQSETLRNEMNQKGRALFLKYHELGRQRQDFYNKVISLTCPRS